MVSVADYRGDEGPPGAEQLSLLPDASYEDLLLPSTPQIVATAVELEPVARGQQ